MLSTNDKKLYNYSSFLYKIKNYLKSRYRIEYF